MHMSDLCQKFNLNLKLLFFLPKLKLHNLLIIANIQP